MIKDFHFENIKAHHVIAAVKTYEDFKIALEKNIQVISMVEGDFFQVTDFLMQAKEEGRTVLLHMDLVEGIGKDRSGICFAKEKFGITGIHSTKTHMLKLAKAEDLITVHRLFITDFKSVESGLSMVKTSKPDFIEIAPGIIPRIVRRMKLKQHRPIFASGLIETPQDIDMLLRAGASNLVCSSHSLWELCEEVNL